MKSFWEVELYKNERVFASGHRHCMSKLISDEDVIGYFYLSQK